MRTGSYTPLMCHNCLKSKYPQFSVELGESKWSDVNQEGDLIQKQNIVPGMLHFCDGKCLGEYVDKAKDSYSGTFDKFRISLKEYMQKKREEVKNGKT